MNMSKLLLISTVILTTGQVTHASGGNAVESVQKQSEQFIDNIFDYAVAQYNAPEGIKLVNEKVNHPVFGEMYVISHKDDIDYYNSNVPQGTKEALVDNVFNYVLDDWTFSSFLGITKDELRDALLKMAGTKVGMNVLKVITSKYMRVYNKYKGLYEKHNVILNDYLDADKRIKELDNEIRNCEYKVNRKTDKKKQISDILNSKKMELQNLFDEGNWKINDVFEDLPKYLCLHKERASIRKQLQEVREKSSKDITAEQKILWLKKKVIGEIMSYDEEVRSAYKIIKTEFARQGIYNIDNITLGKVHNYFSLKSELEKIRQEIKKAREEMEDASDSESESEDETVKEYEKKKEEIKQKIKENAERKGIKKEDYARAIRHAYRSLLQPSAKKVKPRKYEKRYFKEKMAQLDKEVGLDHKVMKELKAHKRFILATKNIAFTTLYNELSQICEINNPMNSKDVNRLIEVTNYFDSRTVSGNFRVELMLAHIANVFNKPNEKLDKFTKKLRIEYKQGKNAYLSSEDAYQIRLSKSENEQNFKITPDHQIISDKPKEEKETSTLDAIQHEVIHHKDDLKKNMSINGKMSISQLDKSVTVKGAFKTKFQEIEKKASDDTIAKLFDRIYDNTAEMAGMYGVIYREGKLYFDPLNEALATAEKDMQYETSDNCDIKTVRTGHTKMAEGSSSLSWTQPSNAEFLKKLDTTTEIYSWYFKPELQKLADL